MPTYRTEPAQETPGRVNIGVDPQMRLNHAAWATLSAERCAGLVDGNVQQADHVLGEDLVALAVAPLGWQLAG